MPTSTDQGVQPLTAFAAPDLSEEEMAEHWANAVANGLEATKLVEVVDIKYAQGQMG